MKIYVAGTFPRLGLAHSVVFHLETTYVEIKQVAAEQGHTVQLPFYEAALGEMNAQDFQQEIHRRIVDADSVITVLDPPSLSVAFEAHFAAGAGKPQAILVKDPANPPPGVRELTQVACYKLEGAPLREIVQELAVMAAQAAKKTAVPPKEEEHQASAWG